MFWKLTNRPTDRLKNIHANRTTPIQLDQPNPLDALLHGWEVFVPPAK